MRKLVVLSALAIVIGMGFSLTANAQSCSDLIWSAERLEQNPNVGNVCLEMVDRDGGTFAKMRAQVMRQGVNSTVVRYQLPDGSWSSSERAYPERGFTAMIDGKEVRITDLAPRQEVNVYIPSEGNWSLPAAPEVAAAAPPPPAPTPAPEPEPEMLPTTATQVSLLALLGTMLVLLGGAVHVVRTRL